MKYDERRAHALKTALEKWPEFKGKSLDVEKFEPGSNEYKITVNGRCLDAAMLYEMRPISKYDRFMERSAL